MIKPDLQKCTNSDPYYSTNMLEDVVPTDKERNMSSKEAREPIACYVLYGYVYVCSECVLGPIKVF